MPSPPGLELRFAIRLKVADALPAICSGGSRLNRLDEAGDMTVPTTGEPPTLPVKLRDENVAGLLNDSMPELSVTDEPELFCTVKLPAPTVWPGAPDELEGITLVTLAAGGGTFNVMLSVPGDINMAGV